MQSLHNFIFKREVCVVFSDALEPSKGKEHKTWKGKMVSRFVRNRSGSGTAVELPDDQEVTGTFGVPLCDCLPSLFNEVYLILFM